MRILRLLPLVLLAGLLACNRLSSVPDPIEIASPQPTQQITKVDLTQAQKSYAAAGNRMALQLLPILVKGERNTVLSPLSIQYALGMTANGASGETLSQLVKAMGFADGDVEALNAFCNKLLRELPAVDLDVTLKLADALLVNEQYPLLPAFKETVEKTYYAAVDNMSFEDSQKVAARINDWSARNTNGLIDKMLEAGDVSPEAMAYLMNALYFKAQWAETFKEELTSEDFFTPGGCVVYTTPFMHNSGQYNYAAMDGFRILEVPYAGGMFAMYILLPEGEYVGDLPDDVPEKYTFSHLLRDLPSLDWQGMLQKMKPCPVKLSLPKFEILSSFLLNDVLTRLGVELAFTDGAQFDRMFSDPQVQAHISKVIQKARIAVDEWGTEAAAVTVVEMVKNAGFFGEDVVDFNCSHPFAFFIAEKSSGVILFEGALWNPAIGTEF